MNLSLSCSANLSKKKKKKKKKDKFWSALQINKTLIIQNFCVKKKRKLFVPLKSRRDWGRGEGKTIHAQKNCLFERGNGGRGGGGDFA